MSQSPDTAASIDVQLLDTAGLEIDRITIQAAPIFYEQVTLAQLKAIIERDMLVPQREQIVVHEGRALLDDDRSLAQYGVRRLVEELTVVREHVDVALHVVPRLGHTGGPFQLRVHRLTTRVCDVVTLIERELARNGPAGHIRVTDAEGQLWERTNQLPMHEYVTAAGAELTLFYDIDQLPKTTIDPLSKMRLHPIVVDTARIRRRLDEIEGILAREESAQ